MLLIGVCAPGCGGSGPRTMPVTGTVTLYNRGRLPVRVEDFVGVGGMMQSHTPVVTLLPDSALVRPFSGRPIGRPTAPWWLATRATD